MQDLKLSTQRRTTTDDVFDRLHDDIVSLKLLPGAKMSEVEVAEKFGVSRQPVRDAFNRLDNLELLMIRPQRATVVRGFSMRRIEEARFLRLAVEIEVYKNACRVWQPAHSKEINENIGKQIEAANSEQWDKFHALDFEFHVFVCQISGCHMAVETIKACRQRTDRLCALSFNKDREADTIVQDHKDLVNAMQNNDPLKCENVIRLHLARLDPVIAEIRLEHAEFFE